MEPKAGAKGGLDLRVYGAKPTQLEGMWFRVGACQSGLCPALVVRCKTLQVVSVAFPEITWVTADMPNVRKLNLHGSASAEADSKRRAWCFFAEPRRDSTPAACAMFTLGRTFPESGNGNREHMLWDFQQVCTPEGGVAPAASGSASESSLVLQRSLRSRFKTPRKRLWMR